MPDISGVIRKVLNYLCLVIIGLALFLGYSLVFPFHSLNWLELGYYAIFLALLVALFFFAPVISGTRSIVDKAFFLGRYSHLEALNEFIERRGHPHHQMDEFASCLVALMATAINAAEAHFYIFSTSKEAFVRAAAFPRERETDHPAIIFSDPDLEMLRRQTRPIKINEPPAGDGAPVSAIEQNLRASLLLPLKFGDDLIGFIALGKTASGKGYTGRDLTVLKDIVRRLMPAVRDYQLYRSEQGRVKDLMSLRKSIAAVTSQLETGTLLETVVTEAARLLDIPAAALWTVRGEQGKEYFTIRSGTGLSRHFLETQKVPLTQVLPLGAADVNKLPPFIKFSLEDSAGNRELNRDTGLLKALAISVTAHRQLVAALTFFHRDPGREFSAWDIEMARNFAEHIGIAMDNSRLYDLEKKQRLELEKAENERKIFLSAITHELRTPITSMKLVTDLLVEETRTSELVAHRKLMDNLQRSLQSLRTIVEELVEFARLQNPALQIQLEPVPLASIIHSAAELSRPFFNSKQQDLQVQLPPALPMVVADPTRLEQVVVNLLVNASKFTPPGSQALVRASLLDYATTERQVLVEVEDHGGPGIPEEHLPSVFKPYFSTSGRSGMGLGLAIVKRIVELHGGRIQVDSRPGKTVFSFTLPVARP